MTDDTRALQDAPPPLGAPVQSLPDSPASWFTSEEALLVALRRALSDPDAPDEPGGPDDPIEGERSDGAPDVSDRAPAEAAPVESILDDPSALEDLVMRTLLELRESTEQSDLPSALAAIVRVLRELGLAQGDVAPAAIGEATLVETRKLLAHVRLAVLASDRSRFSAERIYDTLAPDVVAWLDHLAERHGDASRRVEDATLGLRCTYALIDLVEQSDTIDVRLVACRLLERGGLADATATRELLARVLADAHVDAVDARRDVLATLGLEPADIELARVRAGATPGKELVRAVDVSRGRAAGELLSIIAASLVERKQPREAFEILRNRVLGRVHEDETDEVSQTREMSALHPIADPIVLPTRGLRLFWSLLKSFQDEDTAADLEGAFRRRYGVPDEGEDAWFSRRERLESARLALDQARPGDTVRLLRADAREHDVEALRLSARALEAMEQHERALRTWRAVLDADPGDVQATAGVGRAAIRLGQDGGLRSLELAFQAGHDSPRDAELLAFDALEVGDIAAAERWLAVASEHGLSGFGRRVTRALVDRALEEARRLRRTEDPTQAEALLEVSREHADGRVDEIELEHAAVAFVNMGSEGLMARIAALDDDAREGLARAAWRDQMRQQPTLEPSLALEIAHTLQATSRGRSWPFLLLARTHARMDDMDGVITAAEAGIGAASAEIAVPVRAGQPLDLGPAAERERQDVARLYEELTNAHSTRGDISAAAQSTARGLAHIGLVPRLVRAAAGLLRGSASHEVQLLEDVFAGMLGTDGLTRLTARVKSGAAASAAVPVDDTERSPRRGVATTALSEAGFDDLHAPGSVDALLEHPTLATLPLPAALEVMANALSNPGSIRVEPVRRSERTKTRGDVELAGAAAPLHEREAEAAWTVTRVARASDAFDESS